MVSSALHQSTVFAQYAGCDDSHLDYEDFKACLRNKPAHELLDTLRNWLGPNWPYPSNNSVVEFMVHGYSSLFDSEPEQDGVSGSFSPMASRDDFLSSAPVVLWTPVVDGTVDGIPEIPLNAIERGDYNKVPVLTSTTQVP